MNVADTTPKNNNTYDEGLRRIEGHTHHSEINPNKLDDASAVTDTDKRTQYRFSVLEMLLLTVIGTATIMFIWHINLGFYTEVMLFLVLSVTLVVSSLIIFTLYVLVRSVRSRSLYNILTLLILVTHVLGVPLITNNLIIPKPLADCATQNSPSWGWRNGECVYHYEGKMVDVEYTLLETRNGEEDTHYNKDADTTYVVRDEHNNRGEITARENKITGTTLEDNSIVGKSVLSFREDLNGTRTIAVYAHRDLTAPIEGSHNIMQGFCFEGTLYSNRDNLPDRFLGFYMPLMYKAGECPTDGRWATLQESK